MLTPKAPVDDESVAVDRLPLEVFLSEDEAPLTFVLPPYEDLEEIASLRGSHFSLKEFAHGETAPLQAAISSERKKLEKKFQRFENSHTFLNRLANLANGVADFESEMHFLELAKSTAGAHFAEFLDNRIGENLIARNKNVEAEKVFSKLDLSKNIHANLRLASFHVLRGEAESACDRVGQALKIDPIDFSARLFDGALKIWLGKYEQAIVSFKIAQEQRFNSAILHSNCAIAYLRLNNHEKALRSLRRAVAIDPLHTNAVALLADVAFSKRRSEDAIPSLRYYIRFEQKNSSMWGRLARALLFIGESAEAIVALKRQASIQDSPGVWNNLGVSYAHKGQIQKALESYRHVMEITSSRSDYIYCLAAKNAAGLLSRTLPSSEMVKFVDKIVIPENLDMFCRDRDLSSIFIVLASALTKNRDFGRVSEMCEAILKEPAANAELRAWMATFLIALYSLNENLERAELLADEFTKEELFRNLEKSAARVQLINNIAFVKLEVGKYEEAERLLQKISSSIHKEPYPTATLGLLHLRRNHIDRAAKLYSEALRISGSAEDKARIRQKWHLEVGRSLSESDPRRALRFLQKARDEKNGEPGIVKAATKLMPRLRLN